MRLARLARAHTVLLEGLDASRPWHEQEDELRARHGYGANDGLSQALEQLGHVTLDVVANHVSALQSWAADHGHDVGRSDWAADALVDRVGRFAPDVIFLSDFSIVGHDIVERLREEVGPRAFVAWSGAWFPDERYYQSADLVLTCVPELVEPFREFGRPVELLPHAFDGRVLDGLKPRPAEPEGVVFAGQLQRWEHRHLRRVEVLEQLAAVGVPIEIHAPQQRWDRDLAMRSAARQLAWAVDRALAAARVPQRTRRAYPVLHRLDKWDGRPVSWRSPRLRKHLREPLFGLEMLQRLRDAAVTLNVHADVSVTHASNLRLFEATGVGTCLLTEERPNLHDWFELGEEVVTWTSPDDCVRQVRSLLSDHPRREAIAAAGQARTLRDHSMETRARRFVELVGPWLG